MGGARAMKTPAKLREALDRIESLERRVRELEARPAVQFWPVVLQPAPVVAPPLPPSWPWWQPTEPFYGPFTRDQTVQPLGAPGTFICEAQS
jgi:hypothetical protein